MMKRLMSLLIVLMLFVLGAQAFATSNANGDSWLFVMSAPKGQIVNGKAGNQLILYSVPKHILAFTDRPSRHVRVINTAWFVKNWHKNFGANEPNGAFVHAELAKVKNDNVLPVAVELNHPVLKHHQLTFDIKALSGEALSPSVLTDPNVFIDDVRINCAFDSVGC